MYIKQIVTYIFAFFFFYDSTCFQGQFTLKVAKNPKFGSTEFGISCTQFASFTILQYFPTFQKIEYFISSKFLIMETQSTSIKKRCIFKQKMTIAFS